MKRQLSGAVVALVVVATGSLASACDITPPAASSNGTTISTASLNSQLHTLETTAAGGCLLQLENSQLADTSGQGDGGPGTYTMTFANAVLDNQVEDLLAEQFAASKGITITAADLNTATSDFVSTLQGEISSAVQQSESDGTISFCQDASGASITGTALLAGLPSDIRAAQIRNQAVDEKLLAHGANLSAAAVAAYYDANKSLFTQACVSVIATDTEAHADQLVAEINAGQSFAAVAKASSLDTQTAANGGALGCDYTVSQVEQALQVQSITPGQPIAPVQDSSTGQWVIYEVTSQTVEPLSAAASVARRELLQSTDNVNRVSREIVAFARTSDVSVDPQYGTWKRLAIVPPVAPPSQFLLSAVSGQTPLATRTPASASGTGTGGAATPSSGSGGT
ncbi:MAG: peptidylprolyl isomerase [Acidimicrobiales bacterium]